MESALLPSNAATRARDGRWADAIAVGQRNYLEQIKDKLGIKAKERSITGNEGFLALQEPAVSYEGVFDHENGALRGENSRFLELSY